MLFVAPPQNVASIRAFCAQFDEGLRVEYKRTLDENVRRNLPKVLSSFANSLGGLIVIGVNATNGVPQLPIEGFAAPEEELALTVENICLQGINPPVAPRITIVPSDTADHIFLVIEVDESWDAPHAIENSKRVYVRTGNAANPYDLAEVDLIIELIKRREGPSSRRERIMALAHERARTVVPDGAIHVQVSIAPSYPRRPLCTNDAVWAFLSGTRYRAGRYFPFATLRRVGDGVASFNRAGEYSQISAFGLLLTRKAMSLQHEREEPEIISAADVLHTLVKLLHCASAFYAQVNYRGNVEVVVGLNNIRTRRMPFLQDEFRYYNVEDYECLEERLLVSQQSSTEMIQSPGNELVQDVLRQVCWSFWQSRDDFPAADLRNYIDLVIRQMGV